MLEWKGNCQRDWRLAPRIPNLQHFGSSLHLTVKLRGTGTGTALHPEAPNLQNLANLALPFSPSSFSFPIHLSSPAASFAVVSSSTSPRPTWQSPGPSIPSFFNYFVLFAEGCRAPAPCTSPALRCAVLPPARPGTFTFPKARARAL